MAWSAPPSWSSGQVLAHTDLQTYLTGNTQHLYDIIHGVVNEALTILGDVTLRDDAAIALNLQRNSIDNATAQLVFRKSRGTNAAPTLIATGDLLGEILFRAYDGAAYQNAAYIWAANDGAPGAGDTPGFIGFATTTDGTTTLTERMRINAAGQVLISDGSESLPGISFLNDTNLGFWRVTTDTIGIAATQILFGADGSASVPGLAWEGDTNSGIYHGVSDNNFGFSTGGVSVLAFANAGSAAMGFYNATPVAKPTVTGAKGSNVALGSLLSALSSLGLLTDSSTA